MRLVPDPEKCAGCRICEAICSFVKTNAINPKRSKISVSSDEETGLSVPLVCVNCDDPACIKSCLFEAIQRDPKTSIPVIEIEKCNGCGACIRACPYKAISWDLNGKTVQKCDLCGGDPECIKFCPTNAIILSNLPIPESLLKYIDKVT